jgi:serine/threonine protein kinase
VGLYTLKDCPGVGGMGEVWRASDSRLDREVALKVIPPDLAEDPQRRERFAREARVLAALDHANIATLFGLEAVGNAHVLVMELIEGEGLDKRNARGPLPVDEAMAVATGVAAGLEAAHEKGGRRPGSGRLVPGIMSQPSGFGTRRPLRHGGPSSCDLGFRRRWSPPTAMQSCRLSSVDSTTGP